MHDGKGNAIKNEEDGKRVIAQMNGEIIEEEEEEKPIEKPKKAKLVFVGNILPQSPVMEASLVGENTYDFKPIFEKIKPRVDKADLALASLEGSLAGDLGAYSTVGQYNLPDEILEGLKYSGFNMVNTATDRILDFGKPGFERTLEKIKEAGLDNLGSQTSPSEDTNIYKDVDGIKIALIAASEYYNDKEDLIKSHQMEGLINQIGEGQDLLDSIARAKSKKADLVVVYLNWGEDYNSRANTYQKDLANKLAQAGADLIVGARPHLVQEVEYIDRPDGLKTLVAYSTGNTISNQRLETMSGYMHHKLAQATEVGLLLEVDIVKEDEKTSIAKVDKIPLWVDKATDETGNSRFLIYEAKSEVEKNDLDPAKLLRLKDAIRFIDELTSASFSLDVKPEQAPLEENKPSNEEENPGDQVNLQPESESEIKEDQENLEEKEETDLEKESENLNELENKEEDNN